MNIKQAKERIEKLFDNPITRKRSIIMMGPPGIGKSDICRQITEERKIGFIDIRLSLKNPVDIEGMPFPNKRTKKTDWYYPSFYPNIERDGKEGIILFDEFTSAKPDVLRAIYAIIYDRWFIPDGWMIICATNRIEDNGGTYKMPRPLISRFNQHLKIEPDFQVWKEYALQKSIDENILAFLSRQPEYLYVVSENEIEDEGECNPRTWFYVNELRNVFTDDDEFINATADCIGYGIAAEFGEFLKVKELLPDYNNILNGKEKYQLNNNRTDILWSVIMGLLKRIIKDTKMSRINNAISYVNNMPAEFSYMFVKDLMTQCNTLVLKSPEYQKFIAKNKTVLKDI